MRKANLTAALWLLLCAGCGPPQMGADRDAFKAVDALYTAVGLRDPKRVDQCSATLKGLRDAGKLPAVAAATLDSIVAEARGQQWEPALEHLSGFMEGQRR